MSKDAFIVWSELNEIGFGVRVYKEDYELAKKCVTEGFKFWNDPEKNPQYHDVGYAEPAEKFLKMAGIEYDIFDVDPNVNYEFFDIEVIHF